jgi:preprotein translocase subunit YajC
MMDWMGTMAPIAMAAPQGADNQQSPIFMFGWLAMMIAIFYFILIRPQQRREKERRALLSAVKSGDRVLFGGGLIGTVSNVSEKTFTIKVADKVKVDVIRAAVTQVLEKGAELPDDVPQR